MKLPTCSALMTEVKRCVSGFCGCGTKSANHASLLESPTSSSVGLKRNGLEIGLLTLNFGFDTILNGGKKVRR